MRFAFEFPRDDSVVYKSCLGQDTDDNIPVVYVTVYVLFSDCYHMDVYCVQLHSYSFDVFVVYHQRKKKRSNTSPHNIILCNIILCVYIVFITRDIIYDYDIVFRKQKNIVTYIYIMKSVRAEVNWITIQLQQKKKLAKYEPWNTHTTSCIVSQPAPIIFLFVHQNLRTGHAERVGSTSSFFYYCRMSFIIYILYDRFLILFFLLLLFIVWHIHAFHSGRLFSFSLFIYFFFCNSHNLARQKKKAYFDPAGGVGFLQWRIYRYAAIDGGTIRKRLGGNIRTPRKL